MDKYTPLTKVRASLIRPLCSVCKIPIPLAKLGKIPSYIDGKEVRQFCSRGCRREYVETNKSF